MSASMRAAIVGMCGWAGTRHLAAYRELGIAVVPDPRIERVLGTRLAEDLALENDGAKQYHFIIGKCCGFVLPGRQGRYGQHTFLGIL